MPGFVPPIYYTFPNSRLTKAQQIKLSSLINYVRQSGQNLKQADFQKLNQRIDDLVEYIASGQATSAVPCEFVRELRLLSTSLRETAFPDYGGVANALWCACANVVNNSRFRVVYERAVFRERLLGADAQRRRQLSSVACAVRAVKGLMTGKLIQDLGRACAAFERFAAVWRNSSISARQADESQTAWIETLQDALKEQRQQQIELENQAEQRISQLHARLELAETTFAQQAQQGITLARDKAGENINKLIAETEALREERARAIMDLQLANSEFQAQKQQFEKQTAAQNAQIADYTRTMERQRLEIAEIKEECTALRATCEFQKNGLAAAETAHEKRLTAALLDIQTSNSALSAETAVLRKQVSELQNQLHSEQERATAQQDSMINGQLAQKHIIELQSELQTLQKAYETAQMQAFDRENALQITVNEQQNNIARLTEALQTETLTRASAEQNKNALKATTSAVLFIVNEFKEYMTELAKMADERIAQRQNRAFGQLELAESTICSLEQQMARRNSDADKAAQNVANMQRLYDQEIAALQSQLCNAKNAIPELTNKFLEQINANQAHINSMSVNVADLSQAIQHLSAEQLVQHDDLENELKTCKLQRTQAESLVQDYKAYMAAKQQESQEQMQQLMQHADSLQIKLAETENANNVLEAEKARLDQQLQIAARSCDQLQVEDTRQIQSLRDENTALAARAAELDKLLEAARQEKIMLENELQSVKIQLNEAAQQQQSVAADFQTKIERAELEAQIAAQNASQLLQQRDSELRSAREQASQRGDKIKALQAANQTLREQRNQIMVVIAEQLLPGIQNVKSSVAAAKQLQGSSKNFKMPTAQITALINGAFRQSRIASSLKIEQLTARITEKETERQRQAQLSFALQDKLIEREKDNLCMSNALTRLRKAFTEDVTQVRQGLLQLRQVLKQQIAESQQKDARALMKRILQKEVQQIKGSGDVAKIGQKVQLLSKLMREPRSQTE